ncbi:NADH-quinone oxidoreductase subunit N [Actinomadura pelletieri DSM 43383]|uniref:NADH-quinone oxidoreductase subunit N n=1 Tax=Actinomadura pelletieri DSM 43383 TaxID=1120940 RepID=A0A495QQ66_9ACTN|nr:NADH-quinone oxidoreductase subunit N [Actinomadura pelletieri]RKS75069.1 NADH-quinone oxidoreductase subunit N [Actinomadura pelletieri DSM 43383]
MNENPADLAPELCVLIAAVLGLVNGLFLPRTRQWRVAVTCAAGLVAGLAVAGVAATRPDLVAFDAFEIDPVTHVTRIVVLGSTLLVVVLAAGQVRGHPRESEHYALILLSALGTVALGATSDLLVLVAAYLLASIPAYALAGFGKDAPGTEAALKYYLMGALLGVVMLGGVTLLFGVGRGTGYPMLREGFADASPPVVAVGVVALLAGLLFKAGAVPGHFWVPDVTEGAPPAIAAFVTTVPKVGAFAALYRFGVETSPGGWTVLVAVIAAVTMTLGNLAAFGQDNVRRLLAYSTVSQAGYLLVPVAMAGRTDLAEPAVLYYLAAYAVTNVGAFAVVLAAGRDDLAGYTGLLRGSPLLGLSLVVCLLGLVGTPPTAVFVGKVLMFGAALDGGHAWLAVVAAGNTVASVFYYLRWIVPLFGRRPDVPPPRPARGASAVAVVAAALSVLLGIGSGLALTAS